MTVDVVLTVNGGKAVCKAINNSKALIGVESGNKIPKPFQPSFVDYPFTKDNLGFQHHLQKVKEYQPKYAVAPDLENSDNISKRLSQAKELAKYCSEVIFITKVKQLTPAQIPDKYAVGIPNQPKFGSNGCHPLMMYRDCSKLHILGGSPLTYPRLKWLNVTSVDSASLVKAAAYGNYYENGEWKENGQITYYQRITKSLNNIHNYWNQ